VRRVRNRGALVAYFPISPIPLDRANGIRLIGLSAILAGASQPAGKNMA